MLVQRTPKGRLTEVVDEKRSAGAIRESVMHLHISERPEEEHASIAAEFPQKLQRLAPTGQFKQNLSALESGERRLRRAGVFLFEGRESVECRIQPAGFAQCQRERIKNETSLVRLLREIFEKSGQAFGGFRRQSRAEFGKPAQWKQPPRQRPVGPGLFVPKIPLHPGKCFGCGRILTGGEGCRTTLKQGWQGLRDRDIRRCRRADFRANRAHESRADCDNRNRTPL